MPLLHVTVLRHVLTLAPLLTSTPTAAQQQVVSHLASTSASAMLTLTCNHIASSSLLQVSTLAALAYHKATGRQATHHKQRLDFIHAQVQLLFTAACCFRCRP
jgi:hypothetical protein